MHTKQNTNPVKYVSGILLLTRKAKGFLVWEGHEDVEISEEDLHGALNGDEVEVEVRGMVLPPKGRAAREPAHPRGTVTKVINRARTEFVAKLAQQDSGAIVAVLDDPRFYMPMILTGNLPPDAKRGVKVVVRLDSFDGMNSPQGHVVKVLGAAGEHRVEMNSIVLEHGFSTEFPSDVADEAKDIAMRHADIIAREAESGKREDFREVTTFTIDPVDAKDFDDALSVRTRPDGTLEIGTHIADASFFVKEGTVLDREASRRATSVYLVDATIPMLPHELSNDVCSLVEGQDRLTFSSVFRLNSKAEILERRFTRSVIRSNKRFTYEQAQKILDDGAGLYISELKMLQTLSRIMRTQREREGAIDFGDNEFRFTLDENGVPVAVVRKARIETNLLIEEFMLLANREVAKFVADRAAKVPEEKLVFLYRIHDDPKPDRIEDLAIFVRAMGYEFGHIKKVNSPHPNPLLNKERGQTKYHARDIRKLLADIAGKPEEKLIKLATLRSMAKAIYSTKNIGHFGLAFEFYTHFTSPIRRYPDILVHRILASHLDGHPISRREYEHLEKLCLNASEQEAKAAGAERESVRYKQVEYISTRIGTEYSGTISGVTDWGVYVEDENSGAEGLARLSSIKSDYFEHKPKEYSIVGQRTKRKLTLGDRVRVKILAADILARTIDVEIIG